VIPSFKQAFESFGTELPIATRILIATSNAMLHYWLHGLIALGLSIYMVHSYMRTEEGRYHWDRRKLSIPLFGRIFTRATLARYARAFSMASGSGMPVLQILQSVAQAVGNRYIGQGLLQLRARIERGETLTRAATASGLFTPLVLQMMGVGEESGTVTEMHVHIAEAYEEEVAYDLKRLGDWIEPVMIIAIGAIVFVLALGVYLPLWDLGAGAMKK
jgi:MSHA biogenesis protein MshG